MAAKTGATLRVVSNRIPNVSAAIASDVRNDVETAGRAIEAAAKAKAPVKTGTLRRSITTEIKNDGYTAIVGPSVEYGIYVEFGTRRRPPRPYMRPAAALVLPKYLDRVKVSIKGAR